jgi:hypothetical protein
MDGSTSYMEILVTNFNITFILLLLLTIMLCYSIQIFINIMARSHTLFSYSKIIWPKVATGDMDACAGNYENGGGEIKFVLCIE